ncbi:hypothetical protein BgiBS90_029416, partial [Biomphalaria glabrata]
WALIVYTCGLLINTSVIEEHYLTYTCSWKTKGNESVLFIVLEKDRKFLVSCIKSPAVEISTNCFPSSSKFVRSYLSQDSLTVMLKPELITKDNQIVCVIGTEDNGTFTKYFQLPHIE